MKLISFKNYSILSHFTIPELTDWVIQDIVERYDVPAISCEEVSEALLDPGGVAFTKEKANYIKFDYSEQHFSCQALHLIAVINVLKNNYKIMESPVGPVIRYYFKYSILVVPLSWHLPILSCFEGFIEAGEQAIKDLYSALGIPEVDNLMAPSSPKIEN